MVSTTYLVSALGSKICFFKDALKTFMKLRMQGWKLLGSASSSAFVGAYAGPPTSYSKRQTRTFSACSPVSLGVASEGAAACAARLAFGGACVG